MTPTIAHGTPAGDAALALGQLSRATGQDVQELMTIYALEGLLARLAVSQYRPDFVLKGGVLLATFSARRTTKDIDLQATHLSNDTEIVRERIAEIARTPMDDGLVFLAETAKASAIRDEDEYPGVRVKIQANLGKTRLFIGVDVNFGDPIWPGPELVEVPRLVDLGLQRIEILGYPLAMVFAEKIVTMIQRGVANTRWRDFADVFTLSGLHAPHGPDLVSAIQATAKWRAVTPSPLLTLLSDMPPVAQERWNRWHERMHCPDTLPGEFCEVLAAVVAFADPVINGTAAHLNWSTRRRRWE